MYSVTALLWLLSVSFPQTASAEEVADESYSPEAVIESANEGEQAESVATSEGAVLDAAAAQAEDVNGEEAADSNVANAQEEDPAKIERKTGLNRLLAKFKRKDGTPVSIGVLEPIDYTTLEFVDLTQDTILQSFSRYGNFNIRIVPTSINALTLDEFRRVVVANKLEVIIVTVLKPTNFDIFLYDRRTPYNIYAHSETLPEETQYRLTKEITEEYVKLITRKALFAYMQEDSFELPREAAETATGSEIPRWIASARNLAMLNREILSNFYASVSVGAALTKGESGMWNSNLVGMQVGYRLIDNFYLEGALDMFSYNAVSVGARYIFQNKNNPFRFSVGLAGALSTNAYALNWDQNYTQGLGSKYIVPSVAIMLPIVEVHFKVEAKFFIALDQPRFIVGLMPGLFMHY